MSLYRPDALDYRRHAWSGKALLLSGLPVWLVSSVTLLFFSGCIAFLLLGSYTRRINVNGEMVSVPRAVNVMSPQHGFIINRLVEPGDTVKKGQVIYAIDVSRTTTSGVVSQHQRKDIEEQIRTVGSMIIRLQESKQVTLDMLLQQQTRYQAAQANSAEILNKAQEGLSIIKANMENYQRYQQSGLINKDQLTSQIALYYQQQNELQTLRGQHENNALQVLTLEGNIRIQAADFDNQIYRLNMQRNDLKRQLTDAEAAGTLLITSPVEGRVDSLSVTPGQMVNGGDSLAQILPGSVSRFELVLWVPDNAVPFLKIDDRVNIRYDAFSSDKFGQFPGSISGISATPSSWQERATYPAAPHAEQSGPNTWYKITVQPDSSTFSWQGRPLEAENGMKATSTLFLEQRKLYQWILSPLYDIRDSVGGITDG
ncbi:colicin V secretion protein CvaA [Winslowiella iniecta]|uniref:Colicin V secretion protein CvaA n=2 Tax=Winslowiella iniecta TaxID=1560201 RepID=A0A0L7T1F0_9GAMM|nr:colicin V secretion protein CvaA [Winslowiella iniecta]KOC94832.1 colicin V secretion protein CvaA [Winslowiella iniecta]